MKNIVFDFDGTLVRHKESYLELLKYILISYGASPQDLDEHIENATSDAELCRKVLSASNLLDGYNKILAINLEHVKRAYLPPVMPKILAELKLRYNLFILSGRDTYSLNHSVRINSIYPFFEDVKGMDLDSYSKPDPRFWKQLQTKHNLNNEETIYVGDKYSDYIFAKASKIAFIGAGWFVEPIQPVYPVFRNLDSFKETLINKSKLKKLVLDFD